MAAFDDPITNVHVIADLETFVAKEAKKQLLSCSLLAVDTEFVSEGNCLTISLIQISTPDRKVFLFDVLKCPRIIGQLKDVLRSSDIRKVMHDCKNDSKVLWGNGNWIQMKNVFDTQLLHQILTSMKTNQPINKQQAGLEKLCKENDVTINSNLKQQIKEELKQNNAYFKTRESDGSLPARMREYAVQDVTALIDLHNKMESSLENWVEKLYKRLIKVSLYADLEGVEHRREYIRDKSLLGMVATPHLLTDIGGGPRH